ncbi:MAG: DivIVA domain-containing protein [Ruminococcus sp.]|jgi:DivIVA domain-containing protein
MAANREFRRALFGGYNRKDVDAYVKEMEYELEIVRLLQQRERAEFQKKLGKCTDGIENEEEKAAPDK